MPCAGYLDGCLCDACRAGAGSLAAPPYDALDWEAYQAGMRAGRLAFRRYGTRAISYECVTGPFQRGYEAGVRDAEYEADA